METMAFCEINKFCQGILKKHWPNVPIYEDITKLNGKQFYGAIDLICGGFPCQPFSVAGKRKGKDDNRYLWPEMLRIVKESKPTWFIGENVAGIINMALEQVCVDLENEGYEVWPLVIPACAINAPHRRNRVWILAHSEHDGRNTTKEQRGDGKAMDGAKEGQEGTFKPSGVHTPAFMADTERQGLQKRQGGSKEAGTWQPAATGSSEWNIEPGVCRVVDGLPGRVDRIKALGNAVVPQIPEILGKYILYASRKNASASRGIDK